LDWTALRGVATLGISAGASGSETLVQDLLTHLGERDALAIEERRVTAERLSFRLPAERA
jgi:4-hydroxy-3-methylbut-2-enyl diphosphate reductase